LPGSMMMLAYREEMPIFGLPGCVIFDPFTSFDVLLPRVLAGEKVTRAEIAQLGHGGLI
jgi:molybdopterin biosynthesis enzyme